MFFFIFQSIYLSKKQILYIILNYLVIYSAVPKVVFFFWKDSRKSRKKTILLEIQDILSICSNFIDFSTYLKLVWQPYLQVHTNLCVIKNESWYMTKMCAIFAAIIIFLVLTSETNTICQHSGLGAISLHLRIQKYELNNFFKNLYSSLAL